ncbi:MAG: NAD(P)H-binding protein [Burkholderiales bacterium]
MTAPDTAPRTALLAGATGLIGAELLALLRGSPRYRHTHVLLRRAVPGIEADARVTPHLIDFAQLPDALPAPLPAVDDVFIALGTTIKVAGSQAAFRRVDFDHVVATARAGRAAGATRLAVVSALGADSNSGVFYNRVKGDMQAAIAQLGFESVVIAQPSLLIGDRTTLGQPTRAGEIWITRLLSPVMGLVPRGVRPIRAIDVARSLIDAMLAARPGVRIKSSGDMQR